MTGFKVFDSLLFTGRPDTSVYGIVSNPVVANFWPNGRDISDLALPPRALVEAAATSANAARTGPSWIDIEHWPITGTPAEISASVDKYKTVAGWFRGVAPTEPVGYYGIIPIRDYWRAIKDPGDAKYKEWQAENDKMGPVADVIDIVFPSIYTFYDDEDGWVEYATAQITEARRLAPGKPVYAFLWPQYHDSNLTLGGQLIPGGYWRKQLNLMFKLADGVVIWGGWQTNWDENAEWWVQTKDFMTNHRRLKRFRDCRRLKDMFDLGGAR